ncbi:E3 ubiquitin-protein ligase siah-1-like isoform X2 [Zootermopsis nevadensis]|uniref:RING-type E3 ubiquitin transferase n=2 Tax=Zootermopsis nevadensis TaxID=136037 RepID=A0A067QN51_ZOONE|nr:E3 ubiquitin-protein ligase siah-1-like isoform X2 [Zootermopsis nevadensis]KDR10760.1 E3 ubiquitin-protein ligase sia-1 [Zootermopsis nevadensis]
MATIIQEVLSELKCRVCMEYFQPPILICANGHCSCNNCRLQVKNCPVCRGTFLNVRNTVLEKVITKLIGRCKNHTFGCNATFPKYDETIKHEKVCPQQPYECPMEGCTWNRPLATMKSHLKEKHGASAGKECGGGVSSLKNFGDNSTWRFVKLFKSEIFVHVSEVRGDTLYTCVFHVGHENESEEFGYFVEISRAAGKEQASAKHTVRNYENDFDEIVISDNCASFNYNFAKKCALRGNRLEMKVQIRSLDTKDSLTS